MATQNQLGLASHHSLVVCTQPATHTAMSDFNLTSGSISAIYSHDEASEDVEITEPVFQVLSCKKVDNTQGGQDRFRCVALRARIRKPETRPFVACSKAQSRSRTRCCFKNASWVVPRALHSRPL